MTRKTTQTYANGRPTKAQLMEYAAHCAQADIEGDVYIIKFATPIGNLNNPRGSAQYYVGWALRGEAERRLQEHRNGQGAAITRAAAEQGIEMNIIAIIPGTVVTERKIKNYGNTRKFVAQLERAGQLIQ
jgi:predicted GIY-YIG superfamily endonuclease